MHAITGDERDVRGFRHGDPFKQIDVARTVQQAIRHGRRRLGSSDLMVAEREERGNIEIIYAFDASGSMKGTKLAQAKKAGIALAYQAIDHKDSVGLVVFAEQVRTELAPQDHFSALLSTITRVRAANQTNITAALHKAIELFSSRGARKHLLILSDLMPTVGSFPRQETLKAVQAALDQRISISLIGIALTPAAERLAREIVDLSQGKLYLLKHLDELDRVVLEDYYSL